MSTALLDPYTRLVSLTEAATSHDLHPETLRNWIKRGEIGGEKRQAGRGPASWFVCPDQVARRKLTHRTRGERKPKPPAAHTRPRLTPTRPTFSLATERAIRRVVIRAWRTGSLAPASPWMAEGADPRDDDQWKAGGPL